MLRLLNFVVNFRFFVFSFNFCNGISIYNIDEIVNWVKFKKDIFLEKCLRNLKKKNLFKFN